MKSVPRGSPSMGKYERRLSILGLVILGIIVVVVAFRAYLAPSMLFEFINVTFCS